MLTEGCGEVECTNSNCSTACPEVKLSPNDAAMKAINLLKAKTPVCQKYKAAVGVKRPGSRKVKANHSRV